MNSELVRLTGGRGSVVGDWTELDWAGLGWAMGSFWVTKAPCDIRSTFGRGTSDAHCQLTISVSACEVSGCPTLGYRTALACLAWAARLPKVLPAPPHWAVSQRMMMSCALELQWIDYF